MFLHQLFGLFRDDVHQCHRGVVVQLVDQAGNLFGLAVAGVHQKQVGIMLLRRFQAGEGDFNLGLFAEEVAEEQAKQFIAG